MSNILIKALAPAVIRGVRTSIAVWLATQIAGNVWWAPVALALSKVLRDKYPGKFEWLPI